MVERVDHGRSLAPPAGCRHARNRQAGDERKSRCIYYRSSEALQQAAEVVAFGGGAFAVAGAALQFLTAAPPALDRRAVGHRIVARLVVLAAGGASEGVGVRELGEASCGGK